MQLRVQAGSQVPLIRENLDYCNEPNQQRTRSSGHRAAKTWKLRKVRCHRPAGTPSDGGKPGSFLIRRRHLRLFARNALLRWQAGLIFDQEAPPPLVTLLPTERKQAPMTCELSSCYLNATWRATRTRDLKTLAQTVGQERTTGRRQDTDDNDQRRHNPTREQRTTAGRRSGGTRGGR